MYAMNGLVLLAYKLIFFYKKKTFILQYISVHLRARICPFACIRISTVYFYTLLCMHACVCILVPRVQKRVECTCV